MTNTVGRAVAASRSLTELFLFFEADTTQSVERLSGRTPILGSGSACSVIWLTYSVWHDRVDGLQPVTESSS